MSHGYVWSLTGIEYKLSEIFEMDQRLGDLGQVRGDDRGCTLYSHLASSPTPAIWHFRDKRIQISYGIDIYQADFQDFLSCCEVFRGYPKKKDETVSILTTAQCYQSCMLESSGTSKIVVGEDPWKSPKRCVVRTFFRLCEADLMRTSVQTSSKCQLYADFRNIAPKKSQKSQKNYFYYLSRSKLF